MIDKNLKQPRIFVLGNFDGVHIGHQSLMAKAKEHAFKQDGVAIAMGFDPLPLQLFGQKVSLLTPEAVKKRLFKTMGVLYITLPFTRQLAAMSKEDFIEKILLQEGRAQGLVVGFNYGFGKNAEGTPEFLRSFLEPRGVFVDIMPPVLYEKEAVSSSRIRLAVERGELETARKMLGRGFSISGIVSPGAQRGRSLGFPTANILGLEDLALPPFGVYAVRVVGLGFGMANLGLRPTFPQGGPSLEVHIFNFEDDLYGQEVEVELLHHIRPEQYFADITALQAQLTRDLTQVKGILGS